MNPTTKQKDGKVEIWNPLQLCLSVCADAIFIHAGHVNIPAFIVDHSVQSEDFWKMIEVAGRGCAE